jgi:AcrR family transcriptional regulator
MGVKERKERERKRVRALILKAAMRLFVEEGYEHVTIRKIAEEIEYSPATIYLYFKDRDEILYTLHAEGFEKLYQRQQTVLAIKNPLERLLKHGEVYVSFGLENPEYYDLMFIMREPARKISEDRQWDIGLRSYGFLKGNVEECIEAGLLPRTDPDVATFSLWSHVHGMVSLIIRDRCIMFSKEELPSIVQRALELMKGSMKGE